MNNLATFKKFKLVSFLFFMIAGLSAFIISFDMFKELHSNNLPGKWVLVSIMIIICALHLLIGIGIVFENRWCFWGLKVYLYLSLVAFPIGTYFSYKALSFIKKHNIDDYFSAVT